MTKPPHSAADLRKRYQAGERDFQGAKLPDAQFCSADLVFANLGGAILTNADLTVANLRHAYLAGADFSHADLSNADLAYANLSGACLAEAHLPEANLTGANLTDADFTGANLFGTNLGDAKLLNARFENATLGGTALVGVPLGPLCAVRTTLSQAASSVVDHTSIAKSLHCPGLLEFLVDTGMPHVVATYLIDSVRALSESDLFQILHSTFLSYGQPDIEFARKLYKALRANGVRVWFFPEDSRPGEKIFAATRGNINKHDRMLLLCSSASLSRPAVLDEISEALDRERREGGLSRLIPVVFDDCLFDGWDSPHPEQRGFGDTLRARVCADFRDPTQFDRQLGRLVDALKKVRPKPERAAG